jgi:5-methyltetrahydrofolate--homocysteine methyltransferase
MSNRLTELLSQRQWLLADGATGTNFFAMGLQTGDAPEMWNVEQPEKVRELQQAFVDAGSDIILTNTFGGTRNRLKLHQAQDRVREINIAAAEITCSVARNAGREVVVAGSMGPTGDLFVPLGALTMEQGIAAFTEQAEALAEGGVDVLWIETISAIDEVKAAVTAAATTGLPVVCTFSFDTNGRTMMGVTPGQVAALMQSLPTTPIAYGGNCGVGAAELVAAITNMSEAALPGDVLIAKSNCGIPEYVEGEIRYNGTPELMAEYVHTVADAGARIIGGCCGTSPEHLRAMRAAMDSHVQGDKPDLATIIARLGQISTGAEDQSRNGPLGENPATQARDPGRRRRGRDPMRKAADDGSFPGGA